MSKTIPWATVTSKGSGIQDNDFMGKGQTFKGELVGLLHVEEASGDKMCQDALQELKEASHAI